MLRWTAIFIAICMVLIAGSAGAVGYLLFVLSGTEAAVIALTILTALALYQTVSARLRDRDDIGDKIADLSRGTADLARQVGELGRQVIALQNQEAARRTRSASDPLAAEIDELGGLVKQLAETVAAHDTRLSDLQAIELPAAALQVVLPQMLEQQVAPPAAPVPEKTEPVAEPVAQVAAAVAAPPAPAAKPELAATGPLKGKTADEIRAILRAAIEDNRIDLYLQPILTLPQRKVRYYEAVTRLRMEDGTLILSSDFLVHAEKNGLIPLIDHVQLFRCVQVLRRLMLKNREVGLFCNISLLTLNEPDIFPQFLEFLDANRALAPSLMLEFTQDSLRSMGPLEQESLGALISLGYRFSMDHVTDLRMGPRDLSEMGVRYVKVPAHALLSKAATAGDIHAADLSDLLGRHGISLIAERIEAESAVVDLLDYDVRFGQGFLFSPPRPVRAEALQGSSVRAEPIVPDFAESRPAAQTPALSALKARAAF
jgi:cyclic-di-GMP phosphodiesterase, flagellum assembly factor TipF